MPERRKVKEDYVLAKCCTPAPPEEIIGYYSHDNLIKVHRKRCAELDNLEPDRLLSIKWQDILAEDSEFTPGDDYADLDEVDLAILAHHEHYGVDYSLVIARKLGMTKQEAFDRHKKLLSMKLIERVEPRIIQYRKGIVEGRWIKHRNHTYYDLTQKGKDYLAYSRR